jgi:FkbM family methyltransferase
MPQGGSLDLGPLGASMARCYGRSSMSAGSLIFSALRVGLRRPLAALRSTFARSNLAARGAVLVRRQMSGIIAEHLGHDVDPLTNGEAWLLREIAPGVRTFVDVGANVGDWTALMLYSAGPEVRGILVDASAQAAAALGRRFAGDARLEIIEAVVSAEPGVVSFFEEPGVGTHSSVLRAHARPGAVERSVPSRTLSALLGARGIERVDYLKVDAEGHDLSVLRGAREMLQAQAIRCLQFEYNDAWLLGGSRLADALGLLEAAGYVTYLLRGDGLHRLPYEWFGEYYSYSNFVAFPSERTEELAYLLRGGV